MGNAFQAFFNKTKASIETLGFRIVAEDAERPWGGFLVIDEAQAARFIAQFFASEQLHPLSSQKLSPKILIVAPEQRLSWQYHHRRSEVWKALEGDLRIAHSFTDKVPDSTPFKPNEIIYLKQEERHRLIGGKTPGVVAEIWQHTNPQHPSNEEDIVRLEDDYSR
jgi:mannose-6-phosphate isomerase